VVDNNGRQNVAGWGGILSAAAAAKGVAGVIVYGACRDIDEIEQLGLPLFALGPIPRTARGRVVEKAFNQPVVISGVRVTSGDLVIGDLSGVVFIPKDRAPQVIECAETLAAREARVQDQIRSGKPLNEALGSTYEQMLHRRSVDRASTVPGRMGVKKKQGRRLLGF